MDKFASNITCSSKSLQTFTFCHLIFMDHKGSVSFLISSFGINMLFHMSDSSYPTTRTPQKTTQQFHMIPFKVWTKIQGKISQGNIFYSPISPSQKLRSSHKCSRYFLIRIEQIAHSTFQNPQNDQKWVATQPLQKSLTQSSSPLCWPL